jgi:hypothetical protein
MNHPFPKLNIGVSPIWKNQTHNITLSKDSLCPFGLVSPSEVCAFIKSHQKMCHREHLSS